MAWTEDLVEQVRTLAQAGFSAARISMEMEGISRNAVIGKCHRSNIKLNGGNGGALFGNQSAKKKPIPVCDEPVVVECFTSSHNVTLFELERWHCRFPIGDPQSPDFAYCGATKMDGRSYCVSCCQIAYRPAEERRA